MAVKLQPLGDRVVVRPSSEEEVTRGGIVIPDTVKEKPQEGEVIAVGPGKKDKDNKPIPLSVKEGDMVLFTKYGPNEIKINGKEYLMAREDDILGIITDN